MNKRVKQSDEDEIQREIDQSEAALIEKLLDNDDDDDNEASANDITLNVFDGLMQFIHYFRKADPAPAFIGRLYDYQKESLAWMLDREMAASDSQKRPTQNWELVAQDVYHSKSLGVSIDMTDMSHKDPIESVEGNVMGGILADEMGLGKTVQMVSLICTHPPPPSTATEETTGLTLVVVPLSLLKQWKGEINKYAPSLRVYIYHGPERSTRLRKYNVVLTTYQTLANDIDTLSRIQWWRIILDEAHIIRNSQTAIARACFTLPGTHRWAMTGTPIHNAYRDLFSLFKFLRVRPYGEIEAWYNLIENPLASGNNKQSAYGAYEQSGFRRLRDLVNQLVMRRTKDTEATDVRLKVGSVVSFGDESRVLWRVAKMGLEEFLAYPIDDPRVSETAIPYTADYKLQRALVYLPPKDVEIHVVDFGPREAAEYIRLATEAVLTIDNAIQEEKVKNPLVHILRMQQSTIHPYLLNDPKKTRKFLREIHDTQSYDLFQSSPKIDYIIGDIWKAPHDVKSLIFSRFTLALDLVEIALEKEGWMSNDDYRVNKSAHRNTPRFVRIDGSKSPDERREAIAELSNDPGVKLMLLQLQAAGVGLNLARASNVYFLEPFFTGAVHAQAIDRVHRIGQVRPVHVKMIIMRNTLEQNILELQSVKDAIQTATFRPLHLGLEQIRAIIAPNK